MAEDIIAKGLASGQWQVRDGADVTRDMHIDADVVIVGTGAGGGISAEILSLTGLRVVMLEEGALRYASRDFHLKEAEAYPGLYQDSGARQTRDKGITILQGRTVGGSTTVNWTSCFRTPATTLGYWGKIGLQGLSVDEMAPWFERAEQRLNMIDWKMAPNPNNAVLQRGAQSIGLRWAPIRRNVKGCLNLGYCGMGCAANAKQSMLVTTIPVALDHGAQLLTRVRAEKVLFAGGKAVGVQARVLAADGLTPGAYQVTVNAATVLLAGGAINTPALLLRSQADDPHNVIGKRTFLHPVPVSGAEMPEKIQGWNGAPQTIYSDHYLDILPLDGPIGYKIEVPPIHPVLTATTLTGFGHNHSDTMHKFQNLQVMLALLRDGFHPDSQGGQVGLKSDGSPLLDYPISKYVWDGMRRAWLTMAEAQFAAGALRVTPTHEDAPPGGYTSWAKARAGINTLPLEILRAKVVSAHVMGGCAMAANAEQGYVDSYGKSFAYDGLYVIDGSVFPTSIGANPQLSIYGLAMRNATALAHKLTGKA